MWRSGQTTPFLLSCNNQSHTKVWALLLALEDMLMLNLVFFLLISSAYSRCALLNHHIS